MVTHYILLILQVKAEFPSFLYIGGSRSTVNFVTISYPTLRRQSLIVCRPVTRFKLRSNPKPFQKRVKTKTLSQRQTALGAQTVWVGPHLGFNYSSLDNSVAFI